VLISLSAPCFASNFPSTANDPSSSFLRVAVEATDWISSFQLTPISSTWGIPYPDQRVWGLDPFYYSNGTITSDTDSIQAGAKQHLAFLIAGHDAGLGANAALNAYLATRDDRYLKIFQVYYGYFQRTQLPNNLAESQSLIGDRQNITTNNDGFWPEQARVEAGHDHVFGTSDDVVQLQPIFPAAEHGNPIAATLIAYYRLTNDLTALRMLEKYGDWLINNQIHSGEYAGAFPVTQYYSMIGWKPRMYETTESAWILCELYMITGNRTYLDAADSAGNYMISRQFTGSNDTHVEGALPYESNRTRYNRSVSTNHAGFTLLAWTQLYRLTGNMLFLTAAKRYANWLLSFQVTPQTAPWGDHTYSNDSMAIGGYYYGYDTDEHTFGWRVALSLWSAAYAIPGLMLLNQVSEDPRYIQSSQLAAKWLMSMRFPDQLMVPLQSLTIVKYIISSWWGLYPQYYQPNMSEVQKSGITDFVEKGRRNLSSILDRNLTWFEQTFNVDFNQIDYQMASRGPQYMKMIWSWWPSIGFEPRYGGDIALGEFAIASYVKYNEQIAGTRILLQKLVQLTKNGQDLPENLTLSIAENQKLLEDAVKDFNDGWFSIASAKLDHASSLVHNLEEALGLFTETMKYKLLQQQLLISFVVVSALLAVTNVYWLKRVRGTDRTHKIHRRQKRSKT
jgi:hypothetical protein